MGVLDVYFQTWTGTVLWHSSQRNLCRLVHSIRQAHQSKILVSSLKDLHQFLLDFVIEFEQLYYQWLRCQLHFVHPCVHLLTHIASKVYCVGPGIIASQWTMERAISHLGCEIHQPSNPYANLSH